MRERNHATKQPKETFSSDVFFGDAAFKQRPTALVCLPEKRELTEPGELTVFRSQGYFMLLWVLGKGTHIVGDEQGDIFTHSGQHIYLVPMGGLLSLRVEQEPLSYIVFSFHPSRHLCLGQCPDHDANTASKSAPTYSGSSTGEKKVACITSVPLSRGVQLWCETVSQYLDYPHINDGVFDVKLQEFFLVLRIDYTRQMMDEFLRHFHCNLTGFRKSVFALGYLNATIEELSEALHYSPSTLKRLFVKEFGQTPQKWMQQQRGRYIYNDIMQREYTLKEIANRYEFTSVSYLCQFCRKHFGMTPQQIRQQDSANGLGE